MRVSFTEELSQLEASLQEEGDLVLRALRSALNALARGDQELADEVIRFDDEVDRRYIGIETGVQSLLARQTPVASTCGSCSRCSGSTSTSSGWPTTA